MEALVWISKSSCATVGRLPSYGNVHYRTNLRSRLPTDSSVLYRTIQIRLPCPTMDTTHAALCDTPSHMIEAA